ncbi:TetR/AcrR family transcriptional regulator C-terminal domain-containing protein [Jiangella ureilytica]
MNSAKSTRRVRLLARTGSPTCRRHTGSPWAAAMRGRAASARAALRRHPWAVGLMDSRSTPGPSTLRHHDAVLGALRAGGFSPVRAARAFSLIDSYVYGFVLQELSLPFTTAAELDVIVDGLLRELPAGDYPHLTEVAAAYAGRPDHDGDAEFEFGLGLIIGALRPDDAGRASAPSQPTRLS